MGRDDSSREVSEPDAGAVVEVSPEVLTGGNNTKLKQRSRAHHPRSGLLDLAETVCKQNG